MKLLSATIRNYRIHQELTTEFDGARTLIGGPNESGKSTLIEAIHRGLFLKATVTGEARASMESTLFPGHPEVELHFEAEGAEYHLAKRFSGQTGTTRLVQVGGKTWQGEEAQSELARLLGVSEASGGRGILDRVCQQWSHVWVWQGSSGEDPSQHAASQQAELLRQLQQAGGAVAMQSELDGRVASRFSQTRNEIFTMAGAPKRNSELADAQARVLGAETDVTRAAERLDRLHQAVQDFEDASSTIERVASDLEELGRQRRAVKETESKVDNLRRLEETQISGLKSAAEKLLSLEAVEKSISNLRESVADLKSALEPTEEKQAALSSKLADTRKNGAKAEQAYDQALEQTREIRLRSELAAAYVSRFEKEARCKELGMRLKRVKALQGEVDDMEGQIASLAPVDEEALKSLQDLERGVAQALATLNAMATEVEVVVADQPVHVGETELAAGGSHTVSDPTDVTIGRTVQLRIHPGGGDSLAAARQKVRDLRQDLRQSLDAYGLESIETAARIAACRTTLQSDLESAQAALKQWDANELAAACKLADAELTALEADVVRGRERIAGVGKPSTIEEARAWVEREEESLRSCEANETICKANRDALREQLHKLDGKANEMLEATAEDKQRLTGHLAQLDLLVNTHGDDKSRAQVLEQAQAAKSKAEAALAQTLSALEALQPEAVAADRERLERAWEEAERQGREAETSRAVSQAALRSDGTDDPNAEVTQAKARLASTAEHLETVSRKSQAIALIDDLFQEEQRALADQFSQPLAQKISDYLRCLFGPGAEAVVSFEDNGLKSIHLVRSGQGGAMTFENLSGGTREQVGAAVRLAVAELLAADHNGTLPVVFDDSFTFSDPERVQTLQRMLDLGASRGLQIIVLTCNPSDYAGLGACQVVLK